MPLLSRIAEMTGGRVLLEHQSPFEGPRTPGYADVTWWLAAVALAMFVLDVASAAEIARQAWRRWRRQPQTRPADRVVA